MYVLMDGVQVPVVRSDAEGRVGRPVAGHCEIQGCGRGTPLKAKPGAQEHQSEMDPADSGLEGRVESVYHSARRANATALNEIPFTHNAGHTRILRVVFNQASTPKRVVTAYFDRTLKG